MLWSNKCYCQGLNLFKRQVRSALLLLLPLLANLALSLENWTATMNMNMSNMNTTAAAVVFRDSHVSLTTQPLVLDSGRCHRHLLALQTAVAARVSGEDNLVEMFFLISHTLYHRCGHFTKLPQQLPKLPGEDREDRSGAGTDRVIRIHCIWHWVR